MTATVEHSPPRPRLLVAAAVIPLRGPRRHRDRGPGAAARASWGLLVGLVLTAVGRGPAGPGATTGVRRRVLAGLGPRPADAATDARLVNLADGLSADQSACPSPDLFVLDDPGANMLAASASRRRRPPSWSPPGCSTLSTASSSSRRRPGLRRAPSGRAAGGLGGRDRRGPTGAHPRRRRSGCTGRPAVRGADRRRVLLRCGSRPRPAARPSAVALTRYPPGLRGALRADAERSAPLFARPTVVRPSLDGRSRAPAVPGMPPRPALDLRIEALRLL